VRLEGIDTRDAAEAFRELEFSVDRESRPKLPEGGYFVVDLLGSEVFAGEEPLGSLIDIMKCGSADVWRVGGGKKSFMFPAIGAVIKEVDIAAKKILLDPEELKKVAVYED
jgi:16S rRNA processing protein RimM